VALRIVHCIRAPVGGLFRHVRDLAREQVRRGHLVGLVADRVSGDRLTEERLGDLAPDLPLGLGRVAMSRDIGWLDLTAATAIRRLVDRLKPDVVHGHGAKGGAHARLAGGGGNAPAVVYTPHGGSLHYGPDTIKGRIYMALERALAARTDAIVFESAFAEGRYREQVGAAIRIARVIPNGLTPEEFEPVAAGSGAADVLFIGELRRLKGVDVLLEALARLHGDRAVSACVVGDGPDAEHFRVLADRLGLANRVRFQGAMPARRAFSEGRILVVPSRAESLPYIVLEAGAAGLPLIATRVGGIPEIVAGTDTPLVPPGDAEALAAAITAALTDPAAGQARARRLAAEIGKRFTIDAMTTAILEVYAEAARGRRGG
jgi:glycosyltransferase involved in cell wall biosynthesis